MIKILKLKIRNKKINFLPRNDCIFLLILLSFIIILSYLLHNDIISWISLTLTMYNIIFNDSMQSLGIFLYSNKKTNFLKIFFFLSIILIITLFIEWENTSTIHFHKLDKIPYNIEHKYINLLSPIILILMTYNNLPISTSFLIFSTFSSLFLVKFILIRAIFGYFFGLISMFIFYLILMNIFNKNNLKIKSKIWNFIQWISTGFLWSFWFSQNIGISLIFIPRIISFVNLLFFLFITLVILFFYLYKNNNILVKNIFISKTQIDNPKSTTIINFIFFLNIFIISKFKIMPDIPFITTFMFIGILLGRELAISIYNNNRLHKKNKKNMLKDSISVISGIIISLLFILFNLFLKKII